MNIISVIFPIFIVIIIGYIFGKTRKSDTTSIVDITLYIATPALVFTSMLEKQIVLHDAIKIWSSVLIIMFGCAVVAWVIFKLMKKKHSGLYLPISVMNTVNIPFPIIFLAFGSEGLFAATLFFIPNALIVYSVGVYVLSKKKFKEGFKEIFKVPLIYAALFGLIFNLLKIEVPELIMSPLNFISMMAIPLVLLVLGINLSKVKIKSVPITILASFLRMGVGFLFGILSVYLFSLTGVLRSVVILDSAMPAAVLSSVLAAKYKNESELVASVVFLTTLISMITIPLLLWFL